MTFRTRVLIVVATAWVVGSAGVSAQQRPRDLYASALTKDRAVRDASRPATLQQIRSAVAAYERVVRTYPASGYCDNALWQAGELSRMAWERSGDEADRRTGIRLLKLLKSGYPSSPLAAGVDAALARFETAPAKGEALVSRDLPSAVKTTGVAASAPPAASAGNARSATPPSEIVTIRKITRTVMPDVVRVSIEMDQELPYRQEQLDHPRRLFFDLRGAYPAPGLADKALKYTDDVVREIRLGRHPQNTTRVVFDTEGTQSYSVFTLYNPYRLIVDFQRPAVASSTAQRVDALPAPPPAAVAPAPAPTTVKPPPVPPPAPVKTPPAPMVMAPNIPVSNAPPPASALPSVPAPAVPAANSNGQFSLARQLGLGVSRIVLDPGHGGHDPGALGSGLNESELVLDVTLRLKKLLEKQPGIDVVMTRDSDVFIPLEQRTAIANREGADLFLSIHANASRNSRARGVETYFLNFASNPEAEAVAARENSASGQTMHSLPEIIRAIALNNKIDESRDFAEMIQKSMVRKLAGRNKELRDLGVKQAPFVVLIGAGMPSVLAEIAFVSNKQEGQLLKTSAYRQQIAEALFEAVGKYQKALKAKTTIAAREQ
jgi:N-acetylmuramoyl-L-alanine amidase